MQIREHSIPYQLYYPITDQYVKEEIIFFDIETTGFSASSSYLYLIGCVYYKDASYHMIQWFCDGIEDEKTVLCNFFTFIKDYRMLVHYNGSGFDLPYLTQKCSQYHLPYDFTTIDSFDIYKKIIPYKKILPLPNLKLKTVEQFLSLPRKDMMDGGQLIKVYAQYVALHALHKVRGNDPLIKVTKESGLPTIQLQDEQELLQLLLLHNEEDVTGLLSVCNILSYTDLMSWKVDVISATQTTESLMIHIHLKQPLPSQIEFSIPLAEQTDESLSLHVRANDSTGVVTIPLFSGERKYFFDNYKDYYYLPVEDTAVHKSIGEYVDKDYRQNAKPATCYVKKEGVFLPQKFKAFTPCFYENYKDKVSWFELTEEFLEDAEKLKTYLQSLI